MKTVELSKTMSFVLRHKPEALGITLNAHGWVSLETLSEALSSHFNSTVSVTQILAVAASDSKQRFTIQEGMIRAAQGHTTTVNLQLVEQTPPELLFHGTVQKFVTSILETGLNKGERQFVHLSENIETATQVGERRGKPIILTIHAAEAAKHGVKFFLSENNVWLTEHMPAKFITTPTGV